MIVGQHTVVVIVGGSSPAKAILPWPEGIADKDYKHDELMEAILEQYGEDAAPPNIAKLAVLTLQNSSDKVSTMKTLSIHLGHVGAEFNQTPRLHLVISARVQTRFSFTNNILCFPNALVICDPDGN